ncbi:MAG: hypothetical protein WAQ25_01355 [Candidatus Saccharimonas sp.]
MNLPNVIYSDGTDFFQNLHNTFPTFSHGFFIMTPSGAGKTYFCDHQKEQIWIDGDKLWIESGAQPNIEWWNGGVQLIERVEQRCDIITAQAVDMGFWVMGSVNFWLKPDAIVIPKWDVLLERIRQRQLSGNYDGGLTAQHTDQLKTHIAIIEKWHTDHNVPRFETIEEAVNTLANQVL